MPGEHDSRNNPPEVIRSKANDRQVGGSHYRKTGGEQHWDRAWRLQYDPFQYIITKWVERWRDKGGVEDLEKAKHAIEKYIELVRAERGSGTEPGPGHTNQDRNTPPTGYVKP